MERETKSNLMEARKQGTGNDLVAAYRPATPEACNAVGMTSQQCAERSDLLSFHACSLDDRGLCPTCAARMRQDEELQARRVMAWQMVEDSRVEMVRGIKEGIEMVYA